MMYCVTDASDLETWSRDKTILMHPDFRMIVLANRPGFPFLGNDFFAAVGQYLTSGVISICFIFNVFELKCYRL